MDEDAYQLIAAWISRAENESDPFVKFFIFYMCLDAWITTESSLDGEGDRIAWLISSDNTLRSCWPKLTDKRQYIDGLIAIGKVEDMRPHRRGKYKFLRNSNDFKQALRFIHQIRCNLFHGGKSPNNTHDVELVTLAGSVLQIWLAYALKYSKR